MASPPCTPETYQLTPVFVVPVTEAVKRCDWPAGIVAAIGEIETDSGPDTFVPDVPPVAVVLAVPAALPLVLRGVSGVNDDPKGLRPAGPLHEARPNAHTNKPNFNNLIRASCPPASQICVFLRDNRIC